MVEYSRDGERRSGRVGLFDGRGMCRDTIAVSEQLSNAFSRFRV